MSASLICPVFQLSTKTLNLLPDPPDTSTSGKEWAPDFTTPLLGAKVDQGGTIELDTHITGVPLPEITWTKDGVPLEAGDRIALGYDSDKVG